MQDTTFPILIAPPRVRNVLLQSTECWIIRRRIIGFVVGRVERDPPYKPAQTVRSSSVLSRRQRQHCEDGGGIHGFDEVFIEAGLATAATVLRLAPPCQGDDRDTA